MQLTLNGKTVSLDIETDMPLLWAIRDEAGLTGTKFGCGVAMCGACTVLLDGEPVRSCSLPASAAVGRKITTIEGLRAPRPCKRPGSPSRCRSAATASRAC